MALFKILKGKSANLPSNKVNGYCYVTIDEHKLYVDYTKDDGTLDRFALNAVSADQWKTARNLNGMVVNGTNNVVNYGTCSTAAATAAKVVSCSNFALITGAEITVKFTTTNTAANPTLNVNSTGAKAIYYRGSAISAGYLAANRTYTFRYNGSQYELVGDINTDTNYYPTTWTWTNGTSSGPTASLSGSGMTTISINAVPSASSNTSGIITTGNQTIAGNKIFTGRTYSNQGTYVADLSGGSGTAGYMHACQIVISSAYQNQTIYFKISQRSRFGEIKIRFSSYNGKDPDLNYFVVTGDINAYIVKSNTSTWDLYIQKSGPYDDIAIFDMQKGSYMSGTSITIKNATVTALPSGYVTASKDSFSGNAATATALTTSAGSATQPIYFNNGKPVATTYTLGKSVPSDAKFTDTTYSPGTGLSLSGTTFNHSNSVTAGTAKGDDNKTLTFGGTFTIPTVTYDAQGHITGKGTTTMTMPANPNTDTHYTTGITAGETGTTSNSATTNGNTFIKIKDNSTHRGQIKIVGSGATTVTSDANGVITINSTDNNTTYGSMSIDEGTTGTATTNRVLTATNLKGIINAHAPTKTGNGASGTWGISISGNAATAGSANNANWLNVNSTLTYGASGLNYFNISGSADGAANTNGTPTADWYHIIRMNHANDNGYYFDIASCFHNNNMYFKRVASGSSSKWQHIWVQGNSVTGAVWNDYAECRESDCEDFGYVLMETGDDSLTKTIERLSHFAGVSSDTWGFSQGETAKAHTPIAVAGRVLVYPYQDRNNYKPGDCVCAAPGGTVDIMTREEVREWPDRIVGTVSCVPEYEEWGGGEGADRDPVKVNGRIWIKVV